MAIDLVSAVNRRVAAAIRTKPFSIHANRPIVSFTFDDAPRSAYTIGAKLLEAVGAYGTYYMAGGLCGLREEGNPILTAEDLVELHEAGHEIACHTFSHRKVSTLSGAQLSEEIRRNQAFISSVCGDVRMRNFSYPFGDVSIGRKLQVQSAFATARGITPGVNSGVADLALLKSVALYAPTRDDATVESYLDQVEREKGWLIFYTHDVGPNPSAWGATEEQLQSVIASATRRGCEILSVRNAVGRLAMAKPG